jgi:hypothetical protein
MLGHNERSCFVAGVDSGAEAQSGPLENAAAPARMVIGADSDSARSTSAGGSNAVVFLIDADAMKKKLLLVGLTMTGTLLASCVGDVFIWAFSGLF